MIESSDLRAKYLSDDQRSENLFPFRFANSESVLSGRAATDGNFRNGDTEDLVKVSLQADGTYFFLVASDTQDATEIELLDSRGQVVATRDGGQDGIEERGTDTIVDYSPATDDDFFLRIHRTGTGADADWGLVGEVELPGQDPDLAPGTRPDIAAAEVGVPETIDVLANDGDDRQGLSIVSVDGNASSGAAIQGDSIVFTATDTMPGEALLFYTVEDSGGNRAQEYLQLSISGQGSTPDPNPDPDPDPDPSGRPEFDTSQPGVRGEITIGNVLPQEIIILLYEAALNRNGNIAFEGMNFWIDQYEEQGRSLEDISGSFLESPEFESVVGDPDTLSDVAFIEGLYQNVLDRQGAQGGIDFWTGQLAGGLSRESALIEFAKGPENLNNSPFIEDILELAPGTWGFVEDWSPEILTPEKTIALLFEAGLDRDGNLDTAGINFWIDQFESHGDLTRISQAFVDSPEFSSSVGDPDTLSNDAFVEGLFFNVLDRAGDPAGVEYWSSRMDSGELDQADTLLAFARSGENLVNSTDIAYLKEVEDGFWDFSL